MPTTFKRLVVSGLICLVAFLGMPHPLQASEGGIPLPGPGGQMQFNSDFSKMWVVSKAPMRLSIVDMQSKAVVNSTPLAGDTGRFYVDPTGKEIWWLNQRGGQVEIFDAATLNKMRTINLGSGWPLRVAFTPDGARAVVIAIGFDGIRVYNTQSGMLESSINELSQFKGRSPTHILPLSNSQQAWVIQFSGPLVLVDLGVPSLKQVFDVRTPTDNPAFDTATGRIWVKETDTASRLRVIDPVQGFVGSANVIGEAEQLVYDSTRKLVWALANHDGVLTVTGFDSANFEKRKEILIDGLAVPRALDGRPFMRIGEIEWGADNRSFWGIVTPSNQVFRLEPDAKRLNSRMTKLSFAPQFLAVNSRTGEAWVSSEAVNYLTPVSWPNEGKKQSKRKK